MNFFKVSFIVLFVISFIGCGDDDSPTGSDPTVPVLTTITVSSITQIYGQSGGNITSDGGAAVSARGVCWSTNTTPTVADNTTTDGTGIGSYNSSITGLTVDTPYYVRAFATNSVGTSYGNAESFTTCSGTVTDYDGNVYQTVTIGTQEWMAENLEVTHYRNGDAIPNVTYSGAWESLSTGAYCNYDNDESYIAVYGRLYNWYAVADSRNIAPDGWHVPTNYEWQTLVDYLGGGTVAGGKMKEAGTAHWTSPNTGATNESGFSALPGGKRTYDGLFGLVGYYAYFWTSGARNHIEAYYRALHYNDSGVSGSNGGYGGRKGYSIRCVRD